MAIFSVIYLLIPISNFHLSFVFLVNIFLTTASELKKQLIIQYIIDVYAWNTLLTWIFYL